MHGIVFAALRDFLTSHLGPDRADAIFGAQPPYLMSAAYSDAEFLSLVERARMLSDEPLESFLQAFGVFTGSQTFPRLYPAYYDLAGDTRTFLLTVESRIHELVRATIPNALPPRLRVLASSEHAVSVSYNSPRQLCGFLHGLVEGTAAHFGGTVDVTQETCVKRGDPSCLFSITMRPLAAHAE
jgi:Haem-NO-binding